MSVTTGPYPNSAPVSDANVPNGTDIHDVAQVVAEILEEGGVTEQRLLDADGELCGEIAARILNKRYPPLEVWPTDATLEAVRLSVPGMRSTLGYALRKHDPIIRAAIAWGSCQPTAEQAMCQAPRWNALGAPELYQALQDARLLERDEPMRNSRLREEA
jgi:hypothetical protein